MLRGDMAMDARLLRWWNGALIWFGRSNLRHPGRWRPVYFAVALMVILWLMRCTPDGLWLSGFIGG